MRGRARSTVNGEKVGGCWVYVRLLQCERGLLCGLCHLSSRAPWLSEVSRFFFGGSFSTLSLSPRPPPSLSVWYVYSNGCQNTHHTNAHKNTNTALLFLVLLCFPPIFLTNQSPTAELMNQGWVLLDVRPPGETDKVRVGFMLWWCFFVWCPTGKVELGCVEARCSCCHPCRRWVGGARHRHTHASAATSSHPRVLTCSHTHFASLFA